MGSGKDPITIGVLSLVHDKAIDTKLIPMLRTPSTKLRFVQLKPADLRAFTPPGDLHAVILLHPFTEGRLSLTDVTDARYSKLLPILSSHFGSHGVCVIAYLIRNLKESTELTHLNTVKTNQPTVFEMASCVILCDKLEDLFQRNIQQLQEFMKVNWKSIRKSPWQDEWFRKTPTGEELVGKQIPNPKSVGEEIYSETRSGKDEGYRDEPSSDGIEETMNDERDEDLTMENDGERKITSMENETSESPPVVLVTDASGFIGSHIVQQLTRKGYTVRGALDLEKGTLDSFEKGTLENVSIQAKIGMLKGMFPKLDLFEAGIRNCYGWMNAVTGCSHVIHTSRFQDGEPAKEDDVTKLLEVCELRGIKQVVLTGGREMISENELGNGEWKSVNSALKDAICKHVSKKAASKFMGFEREEEHWNNEWQSINSVLKDALYKYISEKAAVRFMRRKREKPTFGLSIIKPPVVLGPILCEKADANVEVVSRRMENTPKVWSDICISVCDVRDVAEAHIKAMKLADAIGILYQRVVPHSLSLKDMTDILKSEFKDHGNWFSSTYSSWKRFLSSWDNMSQCLHDLHGNNRESNEHMDLKTKKSVIDMAYSCIERGFIPKMPGYRPREQGKRYPEETTGASVVHGADNTNVDGSEIN